MKLRNVNPSEAPRPTSQLPTARPLNLKSILCATDFSDCSRKAYQYALSLGKQFAAEVVLLHVIEPLPPQVGILEAPIIDPVPREGLTEQLEDWKRQASSDVSSTALVRNGSPPHKEIVEAAKELRTDLIIVGTHGRSAIGRALLGGTAEKVVRYAPCPVLVIREVEHDFLS